MSDAPKKPPGRRREGREAALQFLFSHDLNREAAAAFEEGSPFWQLRTAKAPVRAFAIELLAGIVAHLAELDTAIEAAAENYSISRITTIDRNILRLAAYELLYRDDIPNAVTFNEAVEIAKRFGTEDSPRFINGVLDRILRERTTSQA